MAGIVDNTAALRADIKLYLKTVAIAYGKLAADAGPKAAKQAIEMFYSSYGPYIYRRTGNLKDNSYERYYKNNGSVVYGGVRISSDKMDEYKYGNWSAATVASRTWAGGAHGNVHTFPPLSMAEMQLASMSASIEDEAIAIGKSRGYDTLIF